MHEFIHDTIELHVIAETESEVPIAFEPDTGAWPGEPAKRLEPYGYFEEPPEN